jgi:putative redox protein
MNALTVRHLDGDQFAIDIRGHTLLVDQPVDSGGLDTAPTPTELFLAGLASCVAFYARRFLARHELASEGLSVSLEYEMADRPARVAAARVVLNPPPTLPPERLAAFLAVASHCTVHNSLAQPPVVDVVLGRSAAA